jgi:outer membrane protein
MSCSMKRIGTFETIVLVPLFCVIPTAPLAWDVSIGGGAALRPTYEGSDRYEGSPVLSANITYRDMISLGAGGLSAYWHHDGLRIGAGLTANGGRKDYRINGLFEQGDDRLKGLGDIDPTLGVRIFATYALGWIQFDGAVTKLTRESNSGLFANAGVSAPHKLSNRLILTPHLMTTWANGNYTETHFGITAAQAADSAFPEFRATAGFMRVAAGVNAAYLVNRRWFVGVGADVTRLTGAAAQSPISVSNTNAVVSIITGYRF